MKLHALYSPNQSIRTSIEFDITSESFTAHESLTLWTKNSIALIKGFNIPMGGGGSYDVLFVALYSTCSPCSTYQVELFLEGVHIGLVDL